MDNNSARTYVFIEESWCPDTVAVRAGTAPLPLEGDACVARDHGALQAYECAIGELEHGFAVAYADARVAIRALASTVGGSGPHVAVQQLSDVVKAGLQAMEASGIQIRWVDASDLIVIAQLLPQAAALWVEAIPSGSSSVPALYELSARCRSRNVQLIVDATCSAPTEHACLQDGADVILYGHGGIISANPDLAIATVVAVDVEAQDRLRERRTGLEQPQACDARSACIGLRTLPARLDRSSRSARALAAQLQADARVTAVWLRALRWGESEDVICTDDADIPTAQLCLVLPVPSAGSLMLHLPQSWRRGSADGVATQIRWIPTGAAAQWLGIDGRYMIRVGTECLADLWYELDAALTAALK